MSKFCHPCSQCVKLQEHFVHTIMRFTWLKQQSKCYRSSTTRGGGWISLPLYPMVILILLLLSKTHCRIIAMPPPLITMSKTCYTITPMLFPFLVKSILLTFLPVQNKVAFYPLTFWHCICMTLLKFGHTNKFSHTNSHCVSFLWMILLYYHLLVTDYSSY